MLSGEPEIEKINWHYKTHILKSEEPQKIPDRCFLDTTSNSTYNSKFI